MLGTAGGMYHFRDQIRAGNPTAFFVLNGDVCSDFPLNELYEFHKSKNGKSEVSLSLFIMQLIQVFNRRISFSDHDYEHRSNKTTIHPLWLLGG